MPTDLPSQPDSMRQLSASLYNSNNNTDTGPLLSERPLKNNGMASTVSFPEEAGRVNLPLKEVDSWVISEEARVLLTPFISDQQTLAPTPEKDASYTDEEMDLELLKIEREVELRAGSLRREAEERGELEG